MCITQTLEIKNNTLSSLFVCFILFYLVTLFYVQHIFIQHTLITIRVFLKY